MSGYLTVCADGPFCERLLNICMHRKLTVRDIKRCGTERVIFTTDIPSYHRIRLPAYRTKSRVRIIGRHGLPFIISRYKRRKFAVLGIILIIAFLWYASTHVMGITVFGNDRIPTADILLKLEECGLSPGAKTSDIKPDSIRLSMMQKLDELGWIGINANGSRVYIEIVERIEKDEGIEQDGVIQNLVAKKDGELERLEIREGQTVVKPGSGVRKGDILASGIIDNGENGIRLVKARGEVFAKTVYTKSRSYPLSYTETVPTGRDKKRFTVTVLGKSVPLFFGKNSPYEVYEYSEELKEYHIPVDLLPSLFIKSETYAEALPTQKSRTAQEAVDYGTDELFTELSAELDEGVEIIEQKSDHTLNEHGEVEVSVELICRENIAVPEIIERD